MCPSSLLWCLWVLSIIVDNEPLVILLTVTHFISLNSIEFTRRDSNFRASAWFSPFSWSNLCLLAFLCLLYWRWVVTFFLPVIVKTPLTQSQRMCLNHSLFNEASLSEETVKIFLAALTYLTQRFYKLADFFSTVHVTEKSREPNFHQLVPNVYAPLSVTPSVLCQTIILKCSAFPHSDSAPTSHLHPPRCPLVTSKHPISPTLLWRTDPNSWCSHLCGLPSHWAHVHLWLASNGWDMAQVVGRHTCD